jgi:hypothetical protein
MQSKSSDEWSRLGKFEYGVWAFLVLAGILALRWFGSYQKDTGISTDPLPRESPDGERGAD